VTDLAGYGVVVVGGSHGIGAAVSTLLAASGAGVVVNGRDGHSVDATVDAITAGGGSAVGLSGSASGERVAEALMVLCENEFGAVNALINCSGVAEPPGSSILTVTHREFDDLIDAHLGTVFATCRAAAPRMAAAGGGSIVHFIARFFPSRVGGLRDNRSAPAAGSRHEENGLRLPPGQPGRIWMQSQSTIIRRCGLRDFTNAATASRVG
jgi:NAD(P)-dependent dehydrogenase (short-subunit alcohol dehydrogenase family)